MEAQENVHYFKVLLNHMKSHMPSFVIDCFLFVFFCVLFCFVLGVFLPLRDCQGLSFYLAHGPAPVVLGVRCTEAPICGTHSTSSEGFLALKINLDR